METLLQKNQDKWKPKFITAWSKNADIQMLILNCNPVSDHFYKLITCELIFEYLHE